MAGFTELMFHTLKLLPEPNCIRAVHLGLRARIDRVIAAQLPSTLDTAELNEFVEIAKEDHDACTAEEAEAADGVEPEPRFIQVAEPLKIDIYFSLPDGEDVADPLGIYNEHTMITQSLY